jgi:hypothetical protein
MVCNIYQTLMMDCVKTENTEKLEGGGWGLPGRDACAPQPLSLPIVQRFMAERGLCRPQAERSAADQDGDGPAAGILREILGLVHPWPVCYLSGHEPLDCPVGRGGSMPRGSGIGNQDRSPPEPQSSAERLKGSSPFSVTMV